MIYKSHDWSPRTMQIFHASDAIPKDLITVRPNAKIAPSTKEHPSMASAFTPFNRELNKKYKHLGCKIKIGPVGSFLYLRIEDPEGVVSVKVAQEITKEAGAIMADKFRAESRAPINGITYYDNGILANWKWTL